MSAELQFRVTGEPAPQGSKRHVGNGVMVESSKKVTPWRQDVVAAAEPAAHAAAWQPPQAVLVQVTFLFRRPKSHYRTGRNAHLLKPDAPVWHFNKPDIDKLQRSTFDALKTAGVITDDCRIVHVEASKYWAAPDEPTGAVLTITDAVPPIPERETA